MGTWFKIKNMLWISVDAIAPTPLYWFVPREKEEENKKGKKKKIKMFEIKLEYGMKS